MNFDYSYVGCATSAAIIQWK